MEQNDKLDTYVVKPSIESFKVRLLFLYTRGCYCRRPLSVLREVRIRALTSRGPKFLLRQSSANQEGSITLSIRFSASHLLNYIPHEMTMSKSSVDRGQDDGLFHEEREIPTGVSGMGEVRGR